MISLLVFWELRVNRNIIRHATIKSIEKMGFAIFLKELLLVGMILYDEVVPEFKSKNSRFEILDKMNN